MSWYKPKKVFLPEEQVYFDFLEESFMVINERKQLIPYKLTPYQKEYHSYSINIWGSKAPDILWVKARGVSFTVSTIIDLIVTAWKYDGVDIPIIAQREGTGIKHIKTARVIIENCRLPELKNGVKFRETKIVFPNNSTIEAFPSSSAADAVRGLRLITVMVDEFAFQKRDKELIAAVQDTMQGELGQLKIGSTPYGRNNEFYALVNRIKNGEDIGFVLMEVPVFPPDKFKPHILPSQQGLEPVAPWIDLTKLDKKWKRDKNIFLQEQMCDFLDDSISFISYSRVMAVVDENLINAKQQLYKGTFETENPVVVGIDVAEETDFFAIVAFEVLTTTKGPFYKQVFVDAFRGNRFKGGTPELYEYCKDIIDMFPSTIRVRIDRTGIGTGLYKFLRRDYGPKIEGINFSSSINVGDNSGGRKENIKKFMSINLKELIENEQVALIYDDLQIKHLTAVDYSLKAAHTEEGHADLFFANALALMPLDYSALFTEPLQVSVVKKEEDLPNDPKDWTLQQKIEWLKRVKK